MHRFGWLVVALLISGCGYDPDDPYARPGTWNPTGDNDANLRAMVANPHDLIGGTGPGTSAGAEAAPPVKRVFTGKRYPLPALNASSIDIVATPQQQPETGSPGSAQ